MRNICYNQRCKQAYDSTDPDDLDGFGNCPKCKANKQQLVREIEHLVEERRRNNPLPRMPNFNERYPEGVPINARGLGITFDGK